MKHKLSAIGLLLTSLGAILALAATLSWFADANKDVCSEHPFWNSGAVVFIPVVCLVAIVLAFIGSRVGTPRKAVRYASYVAPCLLFPWSIWLLSHFQLFPCGLF
jgi:hypothetical protein